MSFTPGENVGTYRIVEQLGSGGMATVFQAYHAALDRYVAIKVMHPAFKYALHPGRDAQSAPKPRTAHFARNFGCGPFYG